MTERTAIASTSTARTVRRAPCRTAWPLRSRPRSVAVTEPRSSSTVVRRGWRAAGGPPGPAADGPAAAGGWFGGCGRSHLGRAAGVARRRDMALPPRISRSLSGPAMSVSEMVTSEAPPIWRTVKGCEVVMEVHQSSAGAPPPSAEQPIWVVPREGERLARNHSVHPDCLLSPARQPPLARRQQHAPARLGLLRLVVHGAHVVSPSLHLVAQRVGASARAAPPPGSARRRAGRAPPWPGRDLRAGRAERAGQLDLLALLRRRAPAERTAHHALQHLRRLALLCRFAPAQRAAHDALDLSGSIDPMRRNRRRNIRRLHDYASGGRPAGQASLDSIWAAAGDGRSGAAQDEARGSPRHLWTRSRRLRGRSRLRGLSRQLPPQPVHTAGTFGWRRGRRGLRGRCGHHGRSLGAVGGVSSLGGREGGPQDGSAWLGLVDADGRARVVEDHERHFVRPDVAKLDKHGAIGGLLVNSHHAGQSAIGGVAALDQARQAARSGGADAKGCRREPGCAVDVEQFEPHAPLLPGARPVPDHLLHCAVLPVARQQEPGVVPALPDKQVDRGGVDKHEARQQRHQPRARVRPGRPPHLRRHLVGHRLVPQHQ
eukprot:scaffold9560_cov98-Isochrysis_galbana.AAC.2